MHALALAAAVAALATPVTDPPGAIVAGFPLRSYAPGETAQLTVDAPAGPLTVQLYQSGPESRRARRGLGGVSVAAPVRVQWRGGHGTLDLKLESWPSGLYFARLTAAGDRLGNAPFVLRPPDLGVQARIAVVLPTNSWGAYNFRGRATWYADPRVHTVDLTRPFLDYGVPPHFNGYDRGFVRWLAHTGKRADFLSDDDLDAISSGEGLAHLYDLVVFSGHEEYVTGHEYDIVQRFRDLGGNLAFLSANNFFYEVVRQGSVLHGRRRWRDLGRPEARLIGEQYLDWNHGKYENAPYVVVGTARAPWLFDGTGLRDGSSFGTYGIEIDARVPQSPPGLQVLARVPNVFGPGRSAEMTYYETAGGAKVFAAGVINFGGSAENPVVSRLLENLWRHLSRP